MKNPSRVLSIILIIFITLSVAVIACSCGTSSDNANKNDTTGGTTSSADPALASFLADPPKFEEARIMGSESSIPITSYEIIGDMYYLHNSSIDLLVARTNCILTHTH